MDGLFTVSVDLMELSEVRGEQSGGGCSAMIVIHITQGLAHRAASTNEFSPDNKKIHFLLSCFHHHYHNS